MVDKTRNFVIDASFDTWDYTQVGNNPLPPKSQTRRNVPCYRSMQHAGKVDNWKYKLQHGIDATSGFSGQVQSFLVEPGNILFHYTYLDIYGGPVMNTHSERSGNLVGEPTAAFPSSLSTSEAQNQAKVKFLRKCLATQQELQGLVVAGEAAEALRMIRNPAKALFRGIEGYIHTAKRRRNRSPKHRRNHVVAETWLEYVFGWRPLLSDIHSGIEAISQLAEEPPQYEHIVAEHHVDSEPSPPVTFLTGSGIYDKYETNFNKNTARCVFRGTVRCDPPSGARNRKLFGVSWSQVIPSAWELIPYSFLVDYFTNIGQVLDANSFNQSYIEWYLMTVIRTNEVRNVLSACIPTLSNDPKVGYYTNQNHSNGSATARIKLVDRSPGTTQIVPTISFRMPFCDTQWLNMAALLQARR